MGLLIVQLHLNSLVPNGKIKELLKYYQEHLQAQVETNKALEQETMEVDFEQIVLASKDRQQFPLRDLVEFGADQGESQKQYFIILKRISSMSEKVFHFPLSLPRVASFFMAFIC